MQVGCCQWPTRSAPVPPSGYVNPRPLIPFRFHFEIIMIYGGRFLKGEYKCRWVPRSSSFKYYVCRLLSATEGSDLIFCVIDICWNYFAKLLYNNILRDCGRCTNCSNNQCRLNKNINRFWESIAPTLKVNYARSIQVGRGECPKLSVNRCYCNANMW